MISAGGTDAVAKNLIGDLRTPAATGLLVITSLNVTGTATAQVTITAAPTAAFNYPVTLHCAGGGITTPTPILAAGATAGTFTSTAGLTINATTGVVNPTAAVAGTYTHVLDLTGAATGVYLLRLSNADGVETRRLVRE